MRKDVWLVILLASMLGTSLAFAQGTDFQKNMMQQMQNKMMGKMGTNTQPSAPTPTTPIQAKEGVKGKELFNDKTLGTNGRSCGTCHSEGDKPLEGRNVDNWLVSFVQYCYEHALGGEKVMPTDKLDKMIAYFKSLNSKKKSKPGFSPGSAPGNTQVPMQMQPAIQQQQPAQHKKDSWDDDNDSW